MQLDGADLPLLLKSITAIKESRMLAWRSHIDGAVNIVKARSRDEMCKTRMGTLLFSAVRHHLASCLAPLFVSSGRGH
jgi:hypothetical protein